jgi:uncharacterized iron-regulated protein
MKRVAATGSLIAALAILACPDEQRDDHRAEVVAGTVALIQADLAEAETDAGALNEALEGFCAVPDAATLDAAQQT